MPTVHLNGTDLFYLGVGQGTPCLVMHGGLGLDHTYLHPWLDPLGDMFHLIYYDHRGNGRSGVPPFETLTLEQFAADADALSSHLGFEQVAVLGHSVGGFIALTFALHYPERISHLILMDTAPAFDYIEQIMANAQRKGATERMMAALQAPSPADDEAFKRMLFTLMPLYFYEFDAALAGRLMANTVVSAFAAASNDVFMPTYSVISQLGQIQAPTLILVGRDDFICPPSQVEIMHQGIPHSELVVFEHSGHFPHAEEPDVFFSAVKSWFARVACLRPKPQDRTTSRTATLESK
jgi:proline iminopeptidase